MKFLEGTQIYLRPIVTADATPDYVGWVNDCEVTSGLISGYFPITMEGLRSYVTGVSNSSAVMFAICLKESDLHVGNIKLGSFDWFARTCELGIMIGDKNYWGKGIGKDACTLVTDYAFNKLNLEKLWLAVFDNNPKAIKLYEDLGFEIEGTQQRHIYKDGKYWNKILMAKFR